MEFVQDLLLGSIFLEQPEKGLCHLRAGVLLVGISRGGKKKDQQFQNSKISIPLRPPLPLATQTRGCKHAP